MNNSFIDLQVGGFVPLTTKDLPNMLAAVIFCQGCPWRCKYCHNPHLIDNLAESKFKFSEILDFLKKRTGLIDAVVFSGGEPTKQGTLPAAITAVKDLGFFVALHTAGMFPKSLEKLLPYLGWVGMDIKAPLKKYTEIVDRHVTPSRIIESIKLIIENCQDYEFRTTVHPDLTSEEDLLDIASTLSDLGARRYVIQLFRKQGCNNETLLNSDKKLLLSDLTISKLKIGFDQFEVRYENI